MRHLSVLLVFLFSPFLYADTTRCEAAFASSQTSKEEMINLIKTGQISVTYKGLLGRTPLHWAILYQVDDLALELIRQDGVDLNAQNDLKKTPLHYALEVGLERTSFLDSIALELISKKVNINAQSLAGRTPLHYAVLYKANTIALELIRQEGIDFNVQDSTGRTPLHYALGTQQKSIALEIIQTGRAKLDIKDKNGITPQDLIKELGLEPL